MGFTTEERIAHTTNITPYSSLPDAFSCRQTFFIKQTRVSLLGSPLEVKTGVDGVRAQPLTATAR